MISKQNRYRGALVGFLVAESLGSTTEFMTQQEVKEQYGVHQEIIGGGVFDWPKGSITDDGDMTLCVARSLVACGAYNLPDIASRFVDWYNSDPVDMGCTVRAGINRYIRTGELQRPKGDDQAGNGGLMRELPLILRFYGNRHALLPAVVEQARLTHNHPESDEGCCCYASVVSAALQGGKKTTIQRVAQMYPLFLADPYDGKAGGYIVETLRTVLHFFFSTDSFEEAVIGVVNMGQDADTCGAILGGLAGAYYGYDAIPQRWIDALDQEVLKESVQLADAFAPTCRSGLTQEFKDTWQFPDTEVAEPRRSRWEIIFDMSVPEQVAVMRRSDVSINTLRQWSSNGARCFGAPSKTLTKEEILQEALDQLENRIVAGNKPLPKKVNLNKVIVMAEYRPEDMQPISSLLTREQRLERMGEWSGMVSRVRNRIRLLDLPLENPAHWMLLEYGWPGVLDELARIAQKNDIQVVYEPATVS